MWKLGKKGERYWKKAVQNMEVKMLIKSNGDQQQDATKHLKGYCDIDDIEPPWKDKAVCKTRDELFGWENWLEKHFQEK